MTGLSTDPHAQLASGAISTQIAKIRAREQAATPGPWNLGNDNEGTDMPRLLDALEAVLALHQEFCCPCTMGGSCSTIRAITDALGGGE